MTNAGSRAPRTGTVQLGLVAVLVYVLLLAVASRAVLPRIVSPCGRLRHVGAPDDAALSTNQHRLRVPPGRAWAAVDAEVRLAAGEAVTFVVDRVGEDYAAFRLSRLGSLADAALTYADGVVATKTPIAAPAELTTGAPVAVRLARRPGGVALSFGRDGPTFEVPARDPAAPFDVVLFPPSSARLHHAVALGDVRLDDGAALLPTTRDRIAEVASAPAVLALVAGLGTWLGRRPLARWGRRRFPYQTSSEPTAVTLWLVTVIVVLGLVALVPHFELLKSFKPKERGVFTFFVAFVLGWSLVFLAGRDAVLRVFASLRGRSLFAPRWLPALYVAVIVTVLCSVIVAMYVLQIRVLPEQALGRAEPDATLRIAVFGGSSTRGYPYPQGWPNAYPSHLEHMLRARGDAAAVWNLAADGAELDFVEQLVGVALERLAPTHVVLNTVVNNALGDVDAFRDRIARIVAVAAPKVERVVLVKEPALEVVYEAGRWASVAEFYPALDALARPPRIVVVDPIPAFRAHRDEFLMMDDVHLTPRGHRLMAEVLLGGVPGEAAPP